MKIPIILFIGFLLTTCASSNVHQKSESLADLIKSGKNVSFQNVTFEEEIDFTQFEKNLISEGVYQVRIESSITFQDCIFKGKVRTYQKDENQNIVLTSFQSNLTFIGCIFHEEAVFRASSILGRTDFTKSLFLSTANFEECTFFQNAYFRASAFHEELRFQNAVFFQKANFLNAEFDQTASFQASTFNSEAQFSSTKFLGYADFGLIRCLGNFYANYAEFSGRAVFNRGLFFGQADMTDLTFKHCEMQNCMYYSIVRFTKSTVNEVFILDNSFFLAGTPDLSSFDQDKLSLRGVLKQE